MIVHPDKLIELGVIDPFEVAGRRPIGYDLAVGTIYVPPDPLAWKDVGLKSHPDGLASYELPPQGIAVILSKERLNVPKNMLGHALPKSALCERGLLLLNTGLVDPGFNGQLLGVVLNFSKESIALNAGDRFLRLVFTQLTFDAPTISMRSLVDRGKVAKNYPFYFLNLNESARKIAKEAVDGVFPKWGIIIAAVTLLIALITLTVAPILTVNEGHNLEERVRQLELSAAKASAKPTERWHR